MKRQIFDFLVKWKDDIGRLPLVLRGARQVGKSYIVEAFGQACFDDWVVVNFEFQPELSQAFLQKDPLVIVQQLELYLKRRIIPGRTLLFLDEIQQCPDALQSLRYFKEKLPSLHVIAAGSLLEFVLNASNFSFPVGRVQFAYLQPMSFVEYLYNTDDERLLENLALATPNEPPLPLIHQRCTGRVKEYAILGGMPQVLERFRQTRSFIEALPIQSALLQTYANDFGKYAKKSPVESLKHLYQVLPHHIAEIVKYSKLVPDERAETVKKWLQYFEWAGIVTPVYYSSGAGLPLAADKNPKIFKLQFLDQGLLARATQVDPELFFTDDWVSQHAGRLAEQWVGQSLMSQAPFYEPPSLYFWKRDKAGSQAEVDFLLPVGRHVIPIEVKSGKGIRLKSLHQFMKERQSPLGVRISQDPLSFEGGILSVPFYLVHELGRLVAGCIK